jgi:glyoxylase-like metal-dependent hydrolase (beta-lactamase superfamily II)
MHTPGHADGHLVFYSAEYAVLFAGDLLMAGAVGRYDLEDGNLDILKKSLRRIMLLPDETRVLSGHGPATTIGHERHNNPFIREWNLGENS